MTAILDTALVLLPPQQVTTSQSFSAIDVGSVRDLPTTMWATTLTTPPVAAVTFTLESATLAAGPYTVLSTLVWPAGVTGNTQVDVGVAASISGAVSAAHRFLRVSTTQTGAFTGTSYLSKPGGAFGLGNKPGTTVSVV
jgi:hypothetical protein